MDDMPASWMEAAKNLFLSLVVTSLWWLKMVKIMLSRDCWAAGSTLLSLKKGGLELCTTTRGLLTGKSLLFCSYLLVIKSFTISDFKTIFQIGSISDRLKKPLKWFWVRKHQVARSDWGGSLKTARVTLPKIRRNSNKNFTLVRPKCSHFHCHGFVHMSCRVLPVDYDDAQ